MEHQNLWAPWRMAYIRQFTPQNAAQLPESQQSQTCFLCEAAKTTVPSEEAQECLVLLRDERGVILLNRYPYTNGHLLVAPQEHLADLTDLSASQRADLIELTAVGQRLLRTAINPQGFNVGINLGRCAGAGIPGHLHVHVVPRWSGDTNFMETTGGVRVIPEALEDALTHLAGALEKMTETCGDHK